MSGIDALSDREKQTLRLIVRGHDAKSIARHLGLSVHTINERLRDARRKLSVSSSREAARLLLAHEGGDAPQSFGHTEIGAAPPAPAADAPPPPRTRRPAVAAGAFAMSILLALALSATVPQSTRVPDAAPGWSVPQVEAAARAWLALVDAGDWPGSWQAMAPAFRDLNTQDAWAVASRRARTPLGAVRTRTLDRVEDVPAPPAGYVLVRFRTSFANRADATETLTLAPAGNGWRVTGIYVG